jgi:hypothetical protein
VKFGKAGAAIQGNFDGTIFSLVASAIPKWQMIKLLMWVLRLNRLDHLDEIVYGDDDVEGDLDSIQLNLVASTIPKWTFKLLWWVQLLN